MKTVFLFLIASLFASEFTDIEEYDAKVKWSVGITIGNMDMSAPEFDLIDDEFKIKLKNIIKKILPVFVPHIPTVGPIIAPFLSEEDMELEVIDYDKDELAELVLSVLAEDYEIDAGFWKSVKKLVKKAAPIVIKKLVPKIPKIGPIVAPFLGQEEDEEDNNTSPTVPKPANGKCPEGYIRKISVSGPSIYLSDECLRDTRCPEGYKFVNFGSKKHQFSRCVRINTTTLV